MPRSTDMPRSPDISRRCRRSLAALLAVVAIAGAGCGNRRPMEEAFVEAGSVGLSPDEAASGDTGPGGSASGVDGGGGGLGADDGSISGTGDVLGGDAASTAEGAGTTGGSAEGGSTGDGAAAEGSGAAAGPAKYDKGASDTSIRFGSVSALTGLVPDFMQPRGARAYFKFRNAQGGVNGRQMELLIYDDQWDVTRNAALTRQAVQNDGVFAFVANFSPLASHGGLAFIEENKIPVVGGDMINLRTWGKSPNYYPESYLESVAGGRLAGRVAADNGCTRVAGLSLSADESRSWIDAFLQGLKDRGVSDFVYRADVSLAETDYTPYVASMRSAKADCFTMGGETSHFVRLRRAMSQQGYQARGIMPSSAYDPRYVDDAPGSEGDFAVVQYDILENKGSNPAVAEFVTNASRFEPGMKQNGYSLLAWVSAKIAAEAITRMGNEITRDRLFETLNAFSNYDNGITPLLTFREGPHQGATCGNLIKLAGGTWTMAKRNLCL